MEDDELFKYAFMVQSKMSYDPPGYTSYLHDSPERACKAPVLCADSEVKASLENFMISEKINVFAISDGGANFCVLRKFAKVIAYTGKYANLAGYGSKTKRKVPIVSAYIKARSSSIGNKSVILKVNEALYNPQSTITL